MKKIAGGHAHLVLYLAMLPASGNKTFQLGVLASHFPRSQLCFGL